MGLLHPHHQSKSQGWLCQCSEYTWYNGLYSECIVYSIIRPMWKTNFVSSLHPHPHLQPKSQGWWCKYSEHTYYNDPGSEDIASLINLDEDTMQYKSCGITASTFATHICFTHAIMVYTIVRPMCKSCEFTASTSASSTQIPRMIM